MTTSDPPPQPDSSDEDFERQKHEATADEARRQARQAFHDLERYAAHLPEQPGPDRPDKIHVLKIRQHDDPPGVTRYWLARWSVVARLIRDAEGSGDRVEDLGPDALLICQAAARSEWPMGVLVAVGVARRGKWLEWLIPGVTPEPVPGSPQARAQRN